MSGRPSSPSYFAAARTFFCHSCQTEQPMVEKVKTSKHAVRCKTCIERRDRYARTGVVTHSIYSKHRPEYEHSLYEDRLDIPQGIMESYREAMGD